MICKTPPKEVPTSGIALLQAVGASVNQIITLTSSTGFHSSFRKPPAGAFSALLGVQSSPCSLVAPVTSYNSGVHHCIVRAPTASF